MRNVKIWNLDYWKSGEWQVVQERLRDTAGKWTPGHSLCFASLKSFSGPGEVRVMVIGQDPYPNPKYATGVAFSIPKEEKVFPPTLENIFHEYQDDLGLPRPVHGDLSRWTEQGVLL